MFIDGTLTPPGGGVRPCSPWRAVEAAALLFLLSLTVWLGFIRAYPLLGLSSDDIGYMARALLAALVTLYPVNGCTVLAPKSCLTAVGEFDERRKTTQDYDLWFRMAKRYDFLHIPELLFQSRIHSEQGSPRLSDWNEKNLHYLKCLDELYEEGDPSPTGKSRALFHARAAVVLKKREFMDAASHAYALSLGGLPWRDRILDVPPVASRLYFNLYDVRIHARRLRARFRRGTTAK